MQIWSVYSKSWLTQSYGSYLIQPTRTQRSLEKSVTTICDMDIREPSKSVRTLHAASARPKATGPSMSVPLWRHRGCYCLLFSYFMGEDTRIWLPYMVLESKKHVAIWDAFILCHMYILCAVNIMCLYFHGAFNWEIPFFLAAISDLFGLETPQSWVLKLRKHSPQLAAMLLQHLCVRVLRACQAYCIHCRWRCFTVSPGCTNAGLSATVFLPPWKGCRCLVLTCA